MSEFGPIDWKKFERFLFFVGCRFKRQKSSHRIYWRDDLHRPVVVTISKKGMVPTKDIKTNLRTLKITIPDYLNVLRRL